MSVKSKVAKGAIAAVLAGGALVGGSGAAFAGTNGQQIEFFDRQSIANSIWIEGHNQSGQLVTQCVNTPGETTWDSGWWWVGDTSVVGFDQADCTGNTVWSTLAGIPQNQGSNDWYLVSD